VAGNDRVYDCLEEVMDDCDFDDGPELARFLLDQIDPYRVTRLAVTVAEQVDNGVIGVEPSHAVGVRFPATLDQVIAQVVEQVRFVLDEIAEGRIQRG
jgi:hypothetical protein